jgi:hypothetical protein
MASQNRVYDLQAAALRPLRPAFFFCAVVPPCFEDPPVPLCLSPRLDAPGEFAITTSFQRRTASDKDCSAPAAQPRGTRREPAWTIVLKGRARAGADEADVDGVEVVHAPGEGDDTIAAIAEANRDVVVVTADRELAERVRAANAEVVGPSWPHDQLVD